MIYFTFDDGYSSFKTYGVPQLNHYGYCATVFISTSFLGKGPYPYEYYILHNLTHATPRPAPTPEILREYKKQVRRFKKRESSIETTVQNYCDSTNSFPDFSSRFLQSDEVVELSGLHNVCIGAHGHHHLHLSLLPPDLMKNEISQCCANLTQTYNLPLTHFAYPYGNHSHKVRAECAAQGIRHGFTTHSGVNRQWDSLTLKRIDARAYYNAIPNKSKGL
jgi:peptidoglycan/xylan/chitin deacetylase (PgdA/CDA1 family)